MSALYSRSRLYLWRTTGQNPSIRFKVIANVSPNAPSDPETNFCAAKTVKPRKPIR